jgi:hypothetical protein
MDWRILVFTNINLLLEDNYLLINLRYITYANMTSTLRFVDTRAIYRWYNLIRKCAAKCHDEKQKNKSEQFQNLIENRRN